MFSKTKWIVVAVSILILSQTVLFKQAKAAIGGPGICGTMCIGNPYAMQRAAMERQAMSVYSGIPLFPTSPMYPQMQMGQMGMVNSMNVWNGGYSPMSYPMPAMYYGPPAPMMGAWGSPTF